MSTMMTSTTAGAPIAGIASKSSSSVLSPSRKNNNTSIAVSGRTFSMLDNFSKYNSYQHENENENTHLMMNSSNDADTKIAVNMRVSNV